jgi:hypothetical protein
MRKEDPWKGEEKKVIRLKDSQGCETVRSYTLPYQLPSATRIVGYKNNTKTKDPVRSRR